MKMPICLWSGPRNVSTALMYSFAQRDDIRVVDEPLYGHYLRVSGADHPGRDAIIAGMNCDGAAVMRELLALQRQDPAIRFFQKHMAHHLVELDLGFLRETSNIFLIRDPRDMLPSLTVQLPHATLADTGLKTQSQLYDDLRATGQTPAIIDARDLLLDPAGVLSQLCEHLGLGFDPGMLHWAAGPIAEDGIWAPYWYHVVHQSTGFAPYQSKKQYPDELLGLLADCQPWYDRLYENALAGSARGDQ
ncbi:MAG: hypothetical protein WBM80_12825 [Woeseiaceae bacterium]